MSEFKRFALAMLILLVFATVTTAAAQETATIRLTNQSWVHVTAKLVGPTPKIVDLPGYSNYPLRVEPGRYIFLYKVESDNLSYARSDYFEINTGDELTVIACCPRLWDPPYNHRFEGSEDQFTNVTDWPAGVPIEGNPHFNALKVVVWIKGLEENGNAIYTVKGFLNRNLPANVLLPLRQQGFRVTYTGVSTTYSPPATYTEPTMVITYSESLGARHGVFYGVTIDYHLAMYGPGRKSSDPMWETHLTGENDFEVRVNVLDADTSFRNNSLKNLKGNLANFYLDLSDWKIRK